MTMMITMRQMIEIMIMVMIMIRMREGLEIMIMVMIMKRFPLKDGIINPLMTSNFSRIDQ